MKEFRSLTVNNEPLETFKQDVCNATSQTAVGSDSNSLPMLLFEWNSNSPHVTERDDIRSVQELEKNTPDVRVIFAHRDIPHPKYGNGLAELFEKFAIPSAFISESRQNVSQSFSSRIDVDGTRYLWFHLLCKDLATEGESEQRCIVHKLSDEGAGHKQGEDNDPTRQSQANFTWIKPGFVLKISGMKEPSSTQNGSMNSNSDTTLNEIHNDQHVTLFCFGAPETLGSRFRRLKHIATCKDILQDPYVLLEIVFEEMFKIMDGTAWVVSDIFGKIETNTLGIASTPGKASKALDGKHFTGLHNLAKHTIYLRENCEAALATLDNLRTDHQIVSGDKPNPWQKSTQQALDYRKSLFQSTQRRLSSLDKRMTNIIQLSFNLVTQGDSRIMQSENQSMKTIAVMTLIFMPLGTVAAVFGTQLIRLKDDAPYHMEVSRDFWLLWAIAGPLTVLVIVIWLVWYRNAKIELGVKRLEGKRSYMGWKSLREKFRAQNDVVQGRESAP